LRFARAALSDRGQESDYGQEPTIEVGKDSYRLWWRVLVVVIVAGLVVGFIASISYVQYPYMVNVSGTFTSSEGGGASIVGLVACDEWLYTQCSDPGLQPSYDCLAPLVMNLTQMCTLYFFDENPGLYQMSLRNGENYNVTGYLQFKNGTFDKVCFEKVVLTPKTSKHSVTDNLTC